MYHLKCSIVYDRFPSGNQVWKQIGELLAVQSTSDELDSKLSVRMLIRPPDEFKVALKEAQALTDRNRG